MKLIKLNAIESTNSFLKELAQNSTIENYTVVITDRQTRGRGQMSNNWISEPHKNLTISIFINDIDLRIFNQKYLNFAISLAIFDVLFSVQIKALSIKWPNDIMAANNKICGILIENTIKNNKIDSSIIGIGLNVNQIKFPDYLTNVTSLKKITNKDYNLENILLKLVTKIKQRIKLLNLENYQILENDYLNVLYKKNKPTMFKDIKNSLFIGKISGISDQGNLLVELEDGKIKEFGIKEISLA